MRFVWQAIPFSGKRLDIKYVYILRSLSHPAKRYIGLADNLKHRLAEHNSGKAIYTSKYVPWTVETYIAFTDSQKAAEFEQYLKTGSGSAFSRKHFG